MTSNVDLSVQPIQQDFQAVIAYVTGPDTRTATAYTVELTLFRHLLALGAALVRVYFQTRAAARPAGPVHTPDGTVLAYHDCRTTTYYAVFGKVRVVRHAFTAPGQEGVCPLDAALSLPERCYSDLVQEWGTYGTTDESYHKSQTVRARILGLAVGSAALETMVGDAVADSAVFHAQPVSPDVRVADGPLLVVQADGTGVPMVQPPRGARPVRLGKGQKRTKKKEAVVTSLYTIAPYVRTPQEVVAALLQDRERPPEVTRPKPVGKELRATLEGKGVALTRLAERARQREGRTSTTGSRSLMARRPCRRRSKRTSRSRRWCSTSSTPRTISGRRPTRSWAQRTRVAWPGSARIWSNSAPAKRSASSPRWRRRRSNRRARPPNARPSWAPPATTGATRPTCSMTRISRAAGRWVPGSWKGPVVTS